jgi:hypothetical protein
MPPTSTTAASPRARLRALLASGGLVVAPGMFDGLSASLVARIGFGAAYMTGAGIAVAGFASRTSAWSPRPRWPSGPACLCGPSARCR